MEKEEYKQMYEDWQKAEQEYRAKWDKSKEEIQGLIEPKYFDFAESHDTFYSEGIVEIEETDERISGYKNYKHCRIKCVDDRRLYMHTTGNIESYRFESKYEGEEVEYWVWQETGYLGDDYSGFLLLPLLDGKRFWKVGYSC